MFACLWVVVALMPLRAWAWAGMGLGGDLLGAPPASHVVGEVVGEHAPCHAAPAADDTTAAEASACSDCVLCAPLLVTSLPAMSPPLRPGSSPPAVATGLVSLGALESLFRPPRG